MFMFNQHHEIWYDNKYKIDPCIECPVTLLKELGNPKDISLDMLNLVIRSAKEKTIEEYDGDIAGLCATLMPHQRQALHFAIGHKRCLLCMCLGSGKTLVSIALVLILKTTNLVVLPASLIDNWKSEIAKFAPDIVVNHIKKKNLVPIYENNVINMMSYDALRRMYKTFTSFPDLIIVDEAHMAKNDTSKRSVALAFMTKKCERLILLSASPVEKHSSFWHILHMLDTKNFERFFKPSNTQKQLCFASRYCVPEEIYITAHRKQWIFKKNQRAEELHVITKHLVLRMRKEDVLQLPPHYRTRVYIGLLNVAEKQHFKDKMEMITNTKNKNTKDCLLMQLTRDTCHIKVPHVIQYIKTHVLSTENKKCIVFTHHLHIQEKISEFLTHENVEHIVVNGSTNMNARTLLLDTLKNKISTRIGLLSLGACGTGLNIAFISLVLVAELTFNAVAHIQAEGRCHRTGQTEIVYTKYLMLPGSTDDMVWSNICSKEICQEQVLDDSTKRDKKRFRQQEVESDSD